MLSHKWCMFYFSVYAVGLCAIMRCSVGEMCCFFVSLGALNRLTKLFSYFEVGIDMLREPDLDFFTVL